MVNSFLYSSTNYFDKQLLTNDLIIVRNHRDYKEDERDIKRALQRQGAAHINVEIKSNSELQSLTSNTTQSLGSPEIQIDVQNAYIIGFGRYT
jgi:glutaredoxin